LIARGFVEQSASRSAKAKPAASASKAADPVGKPKRPDFDALYGDDEPAAGAKAADSAGSREKIDFDALDMDDEPLAESVAPLPPRLGAAPGSASAPEKKKKKTGGKKRKTQAAGSGDALDKRVIASFGAVGVACVAIVGYMAYDLVLKPPTIVGTWAGSRTEHEIGQGISHMEYRLVLDENHRASMSQGGFSGVGTYTVQGDRLKLSLREKDEDGQEGSASEQEYKISLGRSILDLYEPESGNKIVQLIRFREKPVVAGGAPPSPSEAAPKGLVVGDVNQMDQATEERLATVEFSPKDGAFKLRHPQGWEVETGSRPDNLYSWARFTQGSARIQVFADAAGSMMSGSDSRRDHEEGSEFAPVQTAHELYKRNASEMYSDYKESGPELFKGSRLGEGRIAVFTGSSGGLFGSQLRGYRVTLLTGDRRISILCDGPVGDFAKLKPTFLAVTRSLSH
jgi:hypothetical protein